MRSVRIARRDLDAVVFDMDGVVTRTAAVHAAAWKRLFDAYLLRRGQAEGVEYAPFDSDDDYRRYVDGKNRYDGVASFLASRGIELPRGEPTDPPTAETVCGLGNDKNTYFLSEVERHGVRPFETTVELVRELQRHGFGTALISASRNAELILEAAGLGDLFPVRVDGMVAEELGLPGKPDPAVFIEAARRLGARPERAAIVEDAIAGVQAGRNGGFALVIGVDRSGGDTPGLLENGADVAVLDLAEVEIDDGAAEGGAARPQAAAATVAEPSALVAELGDDPAVFLDYDGTLTPIVNDPAAALIPEETRATLERLARVCPVAIVSGRDLADVRQLVGIDGLVYSGSHGYDVDAPEELGGSQRLGDEYLAALGEAEQALRGEIESIPGAVVERKRVAIAVHYRNVADEAAERQVDEAVSRVAPRFPTLRRTGGKKVYELRPGMDWHKGRVVLTLLERMRAHGAGRGVPVYIGDDVTDEDAFRALAGEGVSIYVGRPGQQTAARHVLPDPSAVCEFLAALADRLEAARP